MSHKIILLTGLAGSGKSTIAKALGAHGYCHMRFAGPLKRMLHSLGLTWEQLDGSEKEKPCEFLGGHMIIDQQLWTRAWKHEVYRLPPSQNIVVDDCRYPNEVNAAKQVGTAKVFRLVRDGSKAVGGIAGHSSEQSLPFDWLVDNNSTIESTIHDILMMMEAKI